MDTPAQDNQPLTNDRMLPRLRAKGHRLELRDTGQPFFWLADTAWELLQRLTKPEIDHYLEIRAAQGFNVIQVVGLSEQGELRANTLGQTPLLDKNPFTPNPDYWTLLDWMLGRAERLGLYVALLPTWADKVTPGWGGGPVIFDPDNARTYGAWLAERYANSSNLIWMLGGDRAPAYDAERHPDRAGDFRPIWRGMAAGILERSPEALITYHTAGGPHNGTGTHLHNEPWLMFNTVQSGHGGGHDLPVWDWITEDFNRTPAKPVLDAEVNYEDHPVNPWPSYDPANGYFRDHDVRKQCWRGVLAGAVGVTYGHHAVWQYHAPGRENINFADRTWFEAMHQPGAVHVGIMRHWLEAFLPLREPAQEVIRSPAWRDRHPPEPESSDRSAIRPAVGEGASHVRAARDPEWRRLAVYVPNSQTLQVHLEPLAGKRLNASWFDPRTGRSEAIGTFAATGERLFSTPLSAPDWVLTLEVVDD